MLDKIVPKLLREYIASNDSVRRAEIVDVLRDYGALPMIFEIAAAAYSDDRDNDDKPVIH